MDAIVWPFLGSWIKNPLWPLWTTVLFVRNKILLFAIYFVCCSVWVQPTNVTSFKIAPVGSYGPAKIRSSSQSPSKVNGAPFEFSKYLSQAQGKMFFSHFSRVKVSEATPFDLYFESSNSAPFTLLGMWEELLILAGP